MSVTSPFPFTYKGSPDSVTCVFKLWFGARYFIFKGLKLHASAENLSTQIHRERLRPKEDSILFKVIAYINRARVTNMTVESIHETDDPVEILKVEYEQLQKAKKDPNCLNTRFVNNDYYPKWIPQTAINEFNKQLQGHVTGKGEKIRKLKKFLSKYTKNSDDLQKIIEYIELRFH
jgi:hypothetical protein